MEVDIDVYFWLVDRGVYDDDQRNKVDMERNKVKMHREHSQRLENGYYIAKLMMILKKSVVKISRKPFSLDPNLANMKDNITSNSKQANWNIILKELKKFGIRVDSDKKQKILEGRTQHICEILSQLFDFDNGGGQGRIGDVSSEMNFGGLGQGSIDSRGNGSKPRDNSTGPPNIDSTNISIDGKDSAVLLGVKAKGLLDPLSPGIKGLSSVKKSGVSKLPLNMGSSPNIKKVKVTQSVTSLNDINPDGKELGDTETTLEFILVGLAKNLGIKPKQAAGLLSNNHKYLIHIAVKGMKGSDYSKMQAWYQNVYAHAKHVVHLIDNEKDHNAMKLTLNILKCGLYSLNKDLVITCIRVLSKIGQEINSEGGQLSGLAWDWFVDNSQQATTTQQQEDVSPKAAMRDLSPGGTINLPPGVLNESGLSACLYAMRKNKSDCIESVAPLFIHFGRNNFMEFFSYHLKRHLPNDQNSRLNFISVVHDVAIAVAGSSMFNDAFVQSGVLEELVSQAIQLADLDPNTQQSNTPKERVAALSFLADIWEAKSDKIEENHEVAQAILTVLKRGCRDRNRILRTVAFEQMFKLLHHFSLNRDQFAPIIYKSLTFLLIEFHQHVEIREQLMRQFVALFQQIQTIPVAILSEPLLKQISISGSTEFNIFDFEFFGVVANHKRSNVSIGLQIIDCMAQQATTQVFYANSASSIVLEIIHRFSREQPLHQHLSKLTESLVQQLDESERWKKQNSSLLLNASISDSPANNRRSRKAPALDAQQTEQQTLALAKKMRERLIVNFLKQLVLFSVDLVKEALRTQLLRAYAKLEGKVVKQPKSLHYLLTLYKSDVPQMLQYFVEQEKQRSRKLSVQKLEESPSGQRMDDYLLADQSLIQPTDDENSYAILSIKKPMTKAQIHLDKALRDIEKIRVTKNDAKDRKTLEEELKKVKDEQLKVTAKKKVERLQLEHGVLKKGTGVARGVSMDNRGAATHQMESGINDVRIVRAKDLADDISEIPNEEGGRFSLVPLEEQNRSKLTQRNPTNVLKQLKEFQLFDLRFEEQKDQDAVRFFVKKHLKILKNLFSKYANTSGPINTVQQTFDELQSKNALMTVAEALKMLKDFQISALQASQKDIMQMFRAINKDILKKKDLHPQQKSAVMTAIDFEGFVEFLMQLAVHLYHYDSAMTPAEYLQKLFEHFRTVGTKNNINLAKLFQAATAEDGLLTSAVADNGVIAELNRRLASDPSYPIPDGYQKVTEKEMENKYVIPAYFPIKHSKRVVVEVLDGILSDIFGFHILEPMSEMKEHVRARPILKQMTKDKVMAEVGLQQNKNAMPSHSTLVKRSRPQDKTVSHSTDAISTLKKGSLARDASKSEIASLQKAINIKNEAAALPKLILGPIIKLEVAKQPAKTRADALEAAYALEEMLQAVEQGQTQLPRLEKNGGQKKAPTNRVIEERWKKAEADEKQRVDDRKKLEERKKSLKETLDKMKEEKKKKDKEDKVKKKEDTKKEKEKEKKKHDKLMDDMNKLKLEFIQKREQREKEEADKKAKDSPVVADPIAKKEQNKQDLKVRKQAVIEQLHAKAEERKTQKEIEEESKVKKDQREKAKAAQIKQMYQETKERAKEMKDRYKDEYNQFKDSAPVKNMFQAYDKALQAFMELQSKSDGVALKDGQQVTLSYNAYMNMGKKLKLFPDVISSQDYIYIYKTMMKTKKLLEKEVKYETLQDVQGTKLNYAEFKEALLKIACLGKYKLKSGGDMSAEEIKEQELYKKRKQKEALKTAAQTGVLKKPKEDDMEGNVNEDLLNMFEKEFDVSDMSDKTIETMLKNNLGLKPDRHPAQQPSPARGGAKASPERNGGATLRAQPVRVGGSQDDR